MPRPDLAYGGPGPILAVALQEQQASWAFYTSTVATHGNQAPLQTLLDSTAQRITLLGNLYQQFGVPLLFEQFGFNERLYQTNKQRLYKQRSF